MKVVPVTGTDDTRSRVIRNSGDELVCDVWHDLTHAYPVDAHFLNPDDFFVEFFFESEHVFASERYIGVFERAVSWKGDGY